NLVIIAPRDCERAGKERSKKVAQTGSLRRFLYRTLIEAGQHSKGLGPDREISDRAAQTASLRYRRRDDLSLSLRPYPWIQAEFRRTFPAPFRPTLEFTNSIRLTEAS